MYFTAERAQQVAVNFRRALVSGGWLIVSPTETSNALFAPLTPVQFPGVLLYRNAVEALPLPAVFEVLRPETQVPFLLEPVAPPAELPQEWTAIESAPAPAQTPDDAGEHVSAARCCAGEGRLGEAIAWCEKAIDADRLNPAYYYLLAIIRQEQGQVEVASQSLSRALYLDPDFALAHFALGNLRLSQGRRTEADRHLANALAVLEGCAQDEILPEADGLTAGRLVEIIASVRASRPRTAAQEERA
jgi:chemotaxis protein methyltransferase CheR